MLHEAVDGVEGVVADLTGEVGIEDGGPETGMAEVFLNQLELDTRLEKVSGIGVAQGVDVGPLADTARLQGSRWKAFWTPPWLTGWTSVAARGCLGAGKSQRG